MLDELGRLAAGHLQVWRVDSGRALPLSGDPGTWQPTLQATRGHVGETPGGAAWFEPVPDHPDYWVQVGPDTNVDGRPRRARATAAVLGTVLGSEQEAQKVAGELAARYEEIDLLYSISEILGRTVRLDEAARTIARELADVAGARRASIMVYDDQSKSLKLVAGRGLETYDVEPVAVDDPNSIAAKVFRDRTMLAFDQGTPGPYPGSGPDRGYKGKSFLSLPIVYAPPGGDPRPVGVINLTDRMGEDVFTAEHKKLLTAIANQVGAAVENARLVESERRRVRLDTELVLARDLQAALMQPQVAQAGGAEIGARTQSAEVVGGDFYKFVSEKNSVGVLVGDVSSHGLPAAMLMAHVIAAAGIIAQDSREPDRALHRLLEVIGGELSRAEMHVTLFYGVVDRVRGSLRFANAGHPQAFVLRSDGSSTRLAATAPPLGLGDGRAIKAGKVTWTPGRDTLVLFSDGFPDATDAKGTRYGEDRLLTLVRHHKAATATAIVDAAFRDVDAFAGHTPDDDRTLVVIR